jgi:hypothetical protein
MDIFGVRNMLSKDAFPFIKDFLNKINEGLISIDPKYKLSFIQKSWLAFCIVGILVTGKFCWTEFEKFSLGDYTVAALSWMLRKSRLNWDFLLCVSIRIILNKYAVKNGHLILDDSDLQRSKSTTKIDKVHKIFDKKTAGYFMGQNIIFLLLVTEKITIPVGFKFYYPDPEKIKWNKEDQNLRKQNIPKSQRPKQPPENPKFPSKIKLALTLLEEFKKHFSDITIQSISADAAYGSSDFFKQSKKLFEKTQIISQLKNNQKVLYKNKLIPVSKLFENINTIETKVQIRGGEFKNVSIASARVLVESHAEYQFVIALKYEGEDEFRYIVASDLTWRAIDIVRAYSLRWLVEVFFSDWKRYEGWGQMALQQGVEGSFRGVILSLLVDHCLLFHPDQFARIENKKPACTVGSLREQIKNESLLFCFQEILLSDSPMEKFAKLKDKFSEFFTVRESSKHLVGRNLDNLKPTESLTRKFGSLKLLHIES